MSPRKNKKNRLLRQLCLTESWIIFFILGIIMMNFPFIIIFNKYTTIFDIPLLFLYYNIGWLISILVIYLFTKATRMCEQNKKSRGDVS